ncbi:MAG: right-handed parallel beta-helix repeat-containing protein, partial [Patescibacteria group bacterium]|nr:right-handed parallel beta-helix repeat-containing protein [Patescibacteria group bacterium]
MTLSCLSTALGFTELDAATDGKATRILYVATDGNDNWSGTLAEPRADDGPFATLQRARDAIRKMKADGGLPDGGVEVRVRGGRYPLADSLEFTSGDSGTPEARVTYRTAPGEEVRLSGGVVLNNAAPVTDQAVLDRLDESVRGKAYQADLKSLGIVDLGEVAASGKRLELFFNDLPMRVSRWPNDGFVSIVDVLAETPVDVRGTKGDRSGKIVYEGDRPNRWGVETDLWLHGYWFWDWAEQRMKVQAIDTGEKVIALAPPHHGYGYRKNQWYYAFNALCEIDEPGEWYLQRTTGVLYFYPPGPMDQARVEVSVTPVLVTMNDVSHVTLRGFIMEGARNHGMTISGGTAVRVAACTFRNLGEWAVRVSGGTDHGVVGCDVYQTGAGGIALSGGDRKSLTPAGHFALNNHIYEISRFTRVYQPGITLQGVGNRAAHNLIHNAPHMAMGFGGNDHVIEFNEIHSVSYESNDAGAIYTGRDWTMRGNVIRHNYLHHISGFRNKGCVGVYLDDMFSSADIIGNVFHKVTRAAMIGGGRDCRVENNIFVDCTPAVHVDARALGWAHGHADMWLK